MIELVFVMMAAAYVIHLFLFWSVRFSKSESYWAREVVRAHSDHSFHN